MPVVFGVCKLNEKLKTNGNFKSGVRRVIDFKMASIRDDTDILDSSIISQARIEDDTCSISSGVFREPRRGIWLRKRKRKEDGDSVSVCSLDVSLNSEPDVKKKKGMSKVASFANLLSTPMKPVMKSLQRTLTSGKGDTPNSLMGSPYSPRRASMCPPTPTSASTNPSPKSSRQVRLHRSWSQTLGKGNAQQAILGLKETKRQEAIFELCAGEENVVEDLELLLATYRNSLLNLRILTEDEVNCIFGDLGPILAAHRQLKVQLHALRDANGVTHAIGDTMVAWIPTLKHYVGYCSNQVWARALLDEKKATNKRFQDFLRRCLESSFSRKLDLWSFLDVPRSRLVKYPLLLTEILRLTPPSHVDALVLPHVSTALSSLLRQVDMATGSAECKRTLERLHFPPSTPSGALRSAKRLLDKANSVKCSGVLRDKRGAKLHCFLFDTCFVAARTMRPGTKLNACYPVIPAKHLEVTDCASENTQRAQDTLSFNVGSKTKASALCLMATDEHVKKHWIDCLTQVVNGAVFLDDSDVEVDAGDQEPDIENGDQENKSPKGSKKDSVKERKLTKSKSARTLRKSRSSLKELSDTKLQPSHRSNGRLHRMSTRSSIDCLI